MKRTPWPFIGILFAIGCTASRPRPPEPLGHEPVAIEESEPRFMANAVEFYRRFPANLLPPAYTGYEFPVSHSIDTTELPTRGAALDRALVDIVVICEAGCPACQEWVPHLFAIVDLFEHVRVSFQHVVRFERSAAMHGLLWQMGSDAERWEALDRVYGTRFDKQSIDQIRGAMGIPALDTLSNAERQAQARYVDEARAAAQNAVHWHNTPTVYVNGVPLAGFDEQQLLTVIPSQAHTALRIHEDTGLVGRELFERVAELNRTNDLSSRGRGAALRVMCNAGVEHMCRTYGESVLRGHTRDPAGDGITVLEKACEAGDLGACVYSQDPPLTPLVQACEQGNGTACVAAAADYLEAADYEKGVQLAKLGCSQSSLVSCSILTGLLALSDPEAAIDRFETLCFEYRDAHSCAQGASLAVQQGRPSEEIRPFLLEGLTYDDGSFGALFAKLLAEQPEKNDIALGWRDALGQPSVPT